MPGTSKKISRLEKEAILRAKDSEYKKEQSAHLLTNSYQDEETFENERHRRHDIMRQTRQIQREIDHQVGMIDKINERKQLELHKKQTSPTKTTTTTSITSRSYLTSSSSAFGSSSVADRPNRGGSGATEKYTSSKHTSGDKIH